MNSLYFVFFSTLFISFISLTQENKEVIKIDVDRDCKKYISKRTYKNEIFTQKISVTSGIEVSFAFSSSKDLEQKRRMIYFQFNENKFRLFDNKTIRLEVDEKDFNFDRPITFQVFETTTLSGEKNETFTIGFLLNDTFTDAIKNASSITLHMFKDLSQKHKNWEFSNSTLTDFVESYNCFVKYYSPIYDRLLKERIKEEEEYQKTLKSYETNFRDSKWYDTKSEVKALEKSEPIIEKDDAIGYKVTLNGDKFRAYFYFNKDRLHKGAYSLQEDYVNENNFYAKYKEIGDILTHKYGEPKKIIKKRNKDLYNEPNEIGMSIQTGEYKEFTLWETKNTYILLSIEGENFDSKLIIEYFTKDPELLLDAKENIQKKQTEGF